MGEKIRNYKFHKKHLILWIPGLAVLAVVLFYSGHQVGVLIGNLINLVTGR